MYHPTYPSPYSSSSPLPVNHSSKNTDPKPPIKTTTTTQEPPTTLISSQPQSLAHQALAPDGKLYTHNHRLLLDASQRDNQRRLLRRDPRFLASPPEVQEAWLRDSDQRVDEHRRDKGIHTSCMFDALGRRLVELPGHVLMGGSASGWRWGGKGSVWVGEGYGGVVGSEDSEDERSGDGDDDDDDDDERESGGKEEEEEEGSEDDADAKEVKDKLEEVRTVFDTADASAPVLCIGRSYDLTGCDPLYLVGLPSDEFVNHSGSHTTLDSAGTKTMESSKGRGPERFVSTGRSYQSTLPSHYPCSGKRKRYIAQDLACE